MINRTIRLYYGCLITLLITVSAITNLSTLLLLLPLNLYFFLAAYRQTIKNRRFTPPLLQPSTAFSFTSFLFQPNFAFRLSLILFLIAMAGSFTGAPPAILSPLP
ncbi:MAG: hypothetical protein AAB430_02905 [Patescibacteria group bacterium]